MSKDHHCIYYFNKLALALKTLIVLLMVMISSSILISAQEANNELFSLTNVQHHVGLSTVELVDPYLSVMDYSGVGVRYEYTATKFFDPHNPFFASNLNIGGLAALTINPQSTAAVSFMGANASWGTQYYYRGLQNAILLGGANVGIDFAYKMNSRNVNNPVNINLATNLNLSLGGRYYIHTKKRIMQFNVGFEFPVIGCMFVPYPGFSYYEMYSTKNYAEAIHFSSLHNKQGLKQFYTIDVPFKNLTWSFGAQLHDVKYEVDNQIYSYSEFTFLIGVTYDIIRFSGRKVTVPETYISPKK